MTDHNVMESLILKNAADRAIARQLLTYAVLGIVALALGIIGLGLVNAAQTLADVIGGIEVVK